MLELVQVCIVLFGSVQFSSPTTLHYSLGHGSTRNLRRGSRMLSLRRVVRACVRSPQTWTVLPTLPQGGLSFHTKSNFYSSRVSIVFIYLYTCVVVHCCITSNTEVRWTPPLTNLFVWSTKAHHISWAGHASAHRLSGGGKHEVCGLNKWPSTHCDMYLSVTDKLYKPICDFYFCKNHRFWFSICMLEM